MPLVSRARVGWPNWAPRSGQRVNSLRIGLQPAPVRARYWIEPASPHAVLSSQVVCSALAVLSVSNWGTVGSVQEKSAAMAGAAAARPQTTVRAKVMSRRMRRTFPARAPRTRGLLSGALLQRGAGEPVAQ